MKIYNDDAPDNKIQLYFRQILTASASLLGIVASGMSNGYSAILLPHLKTSPFNGSDFSSDTISANHLGTLSIDQESWIAAAAVLPIAPGCWASGFLAERLGRKKSLLVLFPIFFVGWLIIGLAGDMETLVVGRLLVGFCVGVLAPLAPIYISETSDPLLRGILIAAITLSLSTGILLCHMLGTWLHWRTTAYICGATPLICLVINMFSRESPMWLLNKDKLEQARSSWIFFRGEQSLEEFALLENSKLADISRQKQADKRSLLRSLWKTWSSRYFLKPLAIICLYFFITQFAGSNAISFYCVELVSNMLELNNAYLITLVIDLIRLIFSVIVCVLMKSCNRRAMTFLSGFGAAATMLSLSACLMFEIGGPWMHVFLFLTYNALVSLGLIALPWLLCGELFSRNFRELGSGLASSFGFLCFFAVVKMTPAMMKFTQPPGTFTFAVYGCGALIGTSILYFVLPETKNKTLQEIQEILDGKPRALTVQNVNIPILKCDSIEKSENLAKDMALDK